MKYKQDKKKKSMHWEMKNISTEYEGSAGVCDYTGKSTTTKLMRNVKKN